MALEIQLSPIDNSMLTLYRIGVYGFSAKYTEIRVQTG